MLLATPIIWLLACGSPPGVFHSQGTCDGIFQPTPMTVRADYSTLLAYVDVNAESVYDGYKAGAGDNELLTGYFGVELQHSVSRDDFRKSVEARLKREGYSTTKPESEWQYMRFVSDAAIHAWLKCKLDGGLALVPQDSGTPKSKLRVEWRSAPGGVGATTVDLDVKGGHFDKGQTHLRLTFLASGEKMVSVIPDPAKDVEIVATSSIDSKTDALTIPAELPKPRLEEINLNQDNDFGGTQPGSTNEAFTTGYMNRMNLAGNVGATGPWQKNGGGPYQLGWAFQVPDGGTYEMWVEFASTAPRPMKVFVGDGILTSPVVTAFAETTSSDTVPEWRPEGHVKLAKGLNHLSFHSDRPPPKINAVRLIRIG